MQRIMFVCKRNSCRSQMAEGFARTLSDGRIAATSAGLAASQVHPTAVQVMAEINIDISQQTSDPLQAFNPQDYDTVISLCGCGASLPQTWLEQERFADWQLEDPDGQAIEIFRRVRNEIHQRVDQLIKSLP